MAGLWDMLRNLVRSGPRVAGPPRAAERASSFHLVWDLPGPPDGPPPAVRRLVEVSATLEVLQPPRVDPLYFWALQVDCGDRQGIWGGAHTGLQWNRRYPGSTAINWGGYAAPGLGGYVLSGSRSSLEGFADDPNTVAYPWQPHRAYRFRIHTSADIPGGWAAEVEDLVSGVRQRIRDLAPPAGRGGAPFYLARPIVWSEVFADCNASSVAVRWSGLRAIDASGAVLLPRAVKVNYQSAAEGGCPNTTVQADGVGILQITAAERSTAQGSLLALP